MTRDVFPYQGDGAAFLAGRERAGLLDKPGVGKTAQVVRACDLRGVSRGMIVCPAAVREHWKSEFADFGRQRRRVVKGVTIHDFVAWANGHYDTLVTSYDLAVRWTKMLHERCELLDFIAFDEAHYLKNPETARARAFLGENTDGVYGAAMWAQQAWWLTGTPVPNDPIDIYSFLKFMRATQMPLEGFRKHYFDVTYRTYGSVQAAKREMTDELRGMIAQHSICRTLDDVGHQLPPIHLTPFMVDGSTDTIKRMLAEHPGLDQAILDAIATDRGIAGIQAKHVATMRRLLAEAKAVPYANMLCGELDSGLDKMVVFAHHREALKIVRDVLLRNNFRCGIIYGDTPEKERVALVRAFQSDPTMRVLLANIRSGGTGLTLTAACHLDMLEADWAPASNWQAIKRIHRLGQIRNVICRLIVLAGSFDVQVQEIVAEKTRAVGELDIAAGGTDMYIPDLSAFTAGTWTLQEMLS